MAVSYMFPVSSPWMEATQGTIVQIKEVVSIKQPTAVVTGNQEVGKTSLLFQSAVSHAAENLSVTYICRKPLTRLPLPVHGMPGPEPAVLQSLKFIYLSSASELIKWCANIHMSPALPDVIIIDDIDIYGSLVKGQSLEHGVATVVAMAMDAAAFVRQKNGSCSLLMSASDRSKSLHSVYRQLHVTVNSIQASQDTPDSEKDFIMTSTFKDNKTLSVSFNMAATQILVKNMALSSSLKS